jgi:hypothetical protein
MSTLKVTTIQDTSGGNASTSEQIAQGRAKAWINFNGTGTVAIRDSFNVSSLTDNGTGDYSMNFSSAMSDANYCVASTGSESGVGGLPRFVCGDGNSTSAALLLTFNSSSKLDYQFCSYVVFGDQ